MNREKRAGVNLLRILNGKGRCYLNKNELSKLTKDSGGSTSYKSLSFMFRLVYRSHDRLGSVCMPIIFLIFISDCGTNWQKEESF